MSQDSLVGHREAVAGMASDLFDVVGIPFEETTELQRQLLAAFAFGMMFAVVHFEKLSPPDAHALAIAMLMDSFRYSDHQAADQADLLIRASQDARVHDTINAVVHRGIDGHLQWQRDDLVALKDNILGIFEAVGA